MKQSENAIVKDFEYFVIKCTKSPKSFGNYQSGLTSLVNERLKAIIPDFTSIFDYQDPNIVERFIEKLESDTEFVKSDETGKKMYSNALQTYLLYVNALNYFRNNEVQENKTRQPLPSNHPLQQIYYGAPGTGKSHIIKELTKGKNVIRTTFHPDSDYSTFVGAYKPTTIEVPLLSNGGQFITKNGTMTWDENNPNLRTEQKIVYEFVNQAFLQAYINAWKAYADAQQGSEPTPQYLVIEEINRGNCAQIFGDLFQLLDRNDSGFSDYPIKADNDMKKQLAKAFKGLDVPKRDSINALYNGDDIVSKVLDGEVLLLPNNLYIWATMNTSDQSLFPIDSAFKRRWDWKYMPINNAGMRWRIAVNDAEYDWWQFLTRVNERIGSTTNSEDKKLGYFFCKAKDEKFISAETFVSKVIFYLWNDVFKDYGFDGTLFQAADGSTLTFDKFYGDNAMAVNEDNVAEFLKNLGLAAVSEMTEEEDAEDLAKENLSNSAQVRFAINGQGKIAQRQLAYEAVKNYVERHTDATVEQVIKAWANTTPWKDFILAENDWLKKTQNFRENRSQALHCADGNVWIKTHGWVYQTEKYGDTTGDFIRLINSREDLGISITIFE